MSERPAIVRHMAALNLKKMPRQPDDAHSYEALSGDQRLALRLELVADRRLDIPLLVMTITLLLAAISATPALWAVQPTAPHPITTVSLIVFLSAMLVFVAMTFVRSGTDPERRRRAWLEMFDYVDKTHPALLFAPPAEKRRRWYRPRRRRSRSG